MDDSSDWPDERLLKAYQNTTYHVFELNLNIRIGKTNSALDRYLENFKAASFVFITAWNPGSALLEEEANRSRNRQLKAALAKTGLPIYEGAGISDAGDWPPEESFFVPGLQLNPALDLAARFEQTAIVYGKLFEAPHLVFL